MDNSALFASIGKAKGFDLNLLLTFEAIFIHLSVSKAASLLSVSPSAVSQSLTKLRNYFSDPLFIREGNGLIATTVAENLHIQLNLGFGHILKSLDNLWDVNTKNTFTIHSTAYVAMRMLPDIMGTIEKNDFKCRITHISSIATFNDDEDILTYHKADVVFDTKPCYSSTIMSELYLSEPIVAVCSKNHPRLGHVLTKENLKYENTTFVTAGSVGVKHSQKEIEGFFGARDYSFVSNSILINAAVTEKTDCVSFIPEWFAKKYSDSLNIRILECDFVVEPAKLYMSYNKSSLNNDNFVELLKQIHECKRLMGH